MKKICENENCKKEFETGRDTRKRFCCRSCSASFNNRGKRRHGEAPGFCIKCGKKLSHKGKYCSHKCHSDFNYESYIKIWLNNEIDGSRSREKTFQIIFVDGLKKNLEKNVLFAEFQDGMAERLL